jgi:hypothetical protein
VQMRTSTGAAGITCSLAHVNRPVAQSLTPYSLLYEFHVMSHECRLKA